MVTGAAIDLNNTISADSLRLDASTGAGAISQTAGSLMVAGEAEFLAQAGDDITLNDANNDFMGAVSLVGRDVTIRTVSNLMIDMASASNDLRLNFGAAEASVFDLASTAGRLTVGGTVFVGGGGADDTILISDTTNIWTLTGINSGTINAGGVNYQFTDLANLIGNMGADTFIFNAGGSLSGRADGGEGVDALDFNGMAQSITITGPGSVDGFAGGATSLADFDNIDSIDGTDAMDTLTVQPETDATYTLTAGTDTYESADGRLPFDNIENIIAGVGDDTFNVDGDHSGDIRSV